MLPPSEVVIRLLLAAALGSVIGLERERLLWAAGLRTHMLVSVGSTLVMIVSAYGFAGVVNTPGVSLDPSRVAAQVVSGIGFLGAGTILLRQEVIRGLTTAASLWAVAAIGLAVGGGLYFPAVAATALILLILLGLKPLERRLFAGHRELQSVVIRLNPSVTSRLQVENAVAKAKVPVRQFRTVAGSTPSEEALELIISANSAEDLAGLVAFLGRLPGVTSVKSGGAVESRAEDPARQ
ncbi:MAG TPA: MgtC/SapB family protein [Gemmatimonadales bacterium]|jgi:putative Mg2+ transporter-C (MgtC) family protein|nr:MgtC/SapB family protein [Gemmatimonadales bacterium]